jgi:carbamoyltransferase
MKLLSYHVQQSFEPIEKGNWDYNKPLSRGHDHNITYYDGEKLHYLKTERLFQEKHHRIYESECDNITKKLWGVTKDTVDDYIFTTFFGNTTGDSNEEYYIIPHIYSKSKINFFQYVDHHYAHALCVSLLEDIDISINIDGSGAFKSWSVYRGDKFIDCGYYETAGSIGGGYSRLRHNFKLSGDRIDAAGKLMGLQSYGKINEGYLEKLREYNFDKGIQPIFDFQPYVNYLDDINEANKTKIDWIRTVHERGGELVLNLFEKYAKPNERIGYSGGVAQNVLWNTILKEKYPNLVIMPYCSDEGLSLGGIEYLRKKHNLSKFNIENFPFAQSDEAPKTSCKQLDRVDRKSTRLNSSHPMY